jgi:hypothetical protein
MLTELTELTVTKKTHTRFVDSGNNTPELVKEQPPREEKLDTQFKPQGLQTVKEDELLCSLIRTAHEIHYR